MIQKPFQLSEFEILNEKVELYYTLQKQLEGLQREGYIQLLQAKNRKEQYEDGFQYFFPGKTWEAKTRIDGDGNLSKKMLETMEGVALDSKKRELLLKERDPKYWFGTIGLDSGIIKAQERFIKGLEVVIQLRNVKSEILGLIDAKGLRSLGSDG